jgi:hypothetical protein
VKATLKPCAKQQQLPIGNSPIHPSIEQDKGFYVALNGTLIKQQFQRGSGG